MALGLGTQIGIGGGAEGVVGQPAGMRFTVPLQGLDLYLRIGYQYESGKKDWLHTGRVPSCGQQRRGSRAILSE
jgi:hypothetical protein